jgi:hydroxypyruvate isomerase
VKRLAANLSMLFTEVPALERPALARASGFDGVEVLFPYDHPAEAWHESLAGMPVALINTPPGDWAAGDRGWAAVPGETARFRQGFAQALHYARLLGATHIHVMCGNAAGPGAEATLAENLRWATARAPGQSLTLEPLNPIDMPGYFLNGFDQAKAIIEGPGLPEVGLQIDLWHIRRLGLDPAEVWARHGALARHVQIAGARDRAEPDAETADWLRGLAGYGDWIAAEYRPAAATTEGLGWITSVRRALDEG